MKLAVSDDAKIYLFSIKSTVVPLFPKDPKNGDRDESKSFPYTANALPRKKLKGDRTIHDPCKTH